MSTPANWVPDEKAKNCFDCLAKFTLVLRKHHCRHCGGVFCYKCSDQQIAIHNSQGPVRVCRNCYHILSTRKKNTAVRVLAKGTKVVYETRSICVQCSVAENQGFRFSHVIAYVIQYANNIYLFSLCAQHRIPQITLICSNAQFYHQIMMYTQSNLFGYNIIDQYLGIPAKTPANALTASQGSQSGDRSGVDEARNQLTAMSLSTAQQQPSDTNGSGGNGGDGQTGTQQQQQQQQQPDTKSEDPYNTLSSLHTTPVQMVIEHPSTPGAFPESIPSGQAFSVESKELYRRIIQVRNYPHLLPLVVELDVTESEGFLRSESDIFSEVYEILSFYPPYIGFVLKVNLGLLGVGSEDPTGDIATVNALIHNICNILWDYRLQQQGLFTQSGSGDDAQPPSSSQASGNDYEDDSDDSELLKGSIGAINPNTGKYKGKSKASPFPEGGSGATTGDRHPGDVTILVDGSFDRLMLLCDCPDTVFLKAYCYPLIRYHLFPGQESVCTAELSLALSKLSTFSHMSCSVMLCVDSDFPQLPNFTSVFQLLTEQTSIVRMVFLYQRRSQQQVVQRHSARYASVSALVEQATRQEPTRVGDGGVGDYHHHHHGGGGHQTHPHLHQQQMEDTLLQQQQQYHAQKHEALSTLAELRIDQAMIEAMTKINIKTTRFSPLLLSSLTYKWLQSPLYYHPKQQQQHQQQQQQPQDAEQDIIGSCMETTDPMPLLGAVNQALGDVAPLSCWLPLSAVSTLTTIIQKKLRSNLIFNFNTDAFGVLCTVIIHRSGFGISNAVSGGGSAAATASGTPSPPIASKIVNLGQIFNLPEVLRQLERVTKTNILTIHQRHTERLVAYSGKQSSGKQSGASSSSASATASQDKRATAAVHEQDSSSSSSSTKSHADGQTSSGGGKFKMITDAYKLYDVLSSNILPKSPVQSITELISVTETKQEQKRKLRSVQFLMVLNAVDIGCIDVLRRCRPFSVARNKIKDSPVKFVNSDNGCL